MRGSNDFLDSAGYSADKTVEYMGRTLPWSGSAACSNYCMRLHTASKGTEVMKRIILLGLIAGLLTGSSGCCLLDQLLCPPFGPGTACNPEHCVGGCGSTCATPCIPDCGPTCAEPCVEPCIEPPCDPCAPACGPDPCLPCGPLTCLANLFRVPSWCGDGCGEMYWGDFHGDPPDCCDPCDRCGNFTGGGSSFGSACGPEMTSQIIDTAPAPRPVPQPRRAPPR